MGIFYDDKYKTFTLQTKDSTYQMKVDENKTLLHTYYGEKTDNTDKSYLICRMDRGFSGNPYELGKDDRTYSPDILPQEYSCFGTGDYRISALKIKHVDGSRGVCLHYEGYEIKEEKYSLKGLPAAYGTGEDVQTLIITLKDSVSGINVLLYYGVFEELDVITRAVEIVNGSISPVILMKAASISLDWQMGEYDWLTFYGRHAMERNLQRAEIVHGQQSVGSIRGTSSHQYNPFAIVCERSATEEQGACYGVSFVYSGEFLMEIEKDQIDQMRLVCGIHPENFEWKLDLGESFTTPEVLLTYGKSGFAGISHSFHKLIRNHICRGIWKDKPRPVLINNWEGTYFHFTGDKLVSIAKEAAELGIELFVMDDGWFGKRDDDNSGLGDWYPNEEKLGCTLKELGEQIVALGMQFGIWFEPESISKDSDLYRMHPEWAVQIPGRKPNLSRNQLILDFSRRDVQDYIIEKLSSVLKSAPVTYIKWDLNRSICDKYSNILPAERQGEMAHGFVLGLYRVLEKLHKEFPDLLIEGCSGGGGRFDAGMLYYTPQIWCSDNTDAIERLKIQYGTSFGYPVSTMGAHVSAVPNHQTGRETPLSTRGCVAMAGTFGYELDINRITEKDKEEIRRQIRIFKRYYNVIQYGNYYRLTTPYANSCTVWQIAAADGTETLVSAVYHHVCANAVPVFVKLKGLCEKAIYRLELICAPDEDILPAGGKVKFLEQGRRLSGAALMHCGLQIPIAWKEFGAWQIYVEKIEYVSPTEQGEAKGGKANISYT
ncbi:alpha-galactosidase [Parablautia muri]|uniref:Alpha-galactosidase n=1 Tax=Parablautia muri TaxID=2320879 RepID=A0A9X5BDK2_9FIRM|nr:alpha-galactosidase [Parablautia muri]NBJ92011.1 alpha-galactosidase [Parablautia muri]